MFTSLALMGPVAHAVGFWWLLFLVPVFWILVFILVFALVGRRMRRSVWEHGGMRHHHFTRSAESTLAERFAQGDIDEKEYRARLEVLRANASDQH